MFKSTHFKIYILAIILVILTGFLLYILYVYNLGIRNNYFVRKDFNNIFNYRSSGNCDEFGKYISNEYAKDWFERCLEEKNRNDKIPIKKFQISSITTSGDKAFLQVALERDNPLESDKDLKYSVNYQMKKVIRKWFLFIPKTQYIIDQGLN